MFFIIIFSDTMSYSYIFRRATNWKDSIPRFVGEINSKFSLSKFVSIAATHGHTNTESLFLFNYSENTVNKSLQDMRLAAEYSLS